MGSEPGAAPALMGARAADPRGVSCDAGTYEGIESSIQDPREKGKSMGTIMTRSRALHTSAALAALAALTAGEHAQASVFNGIESCGFATAFDELGDEFASDDDPCGPGVWARVSVSDGPATSVIIADRKLGFAVFASGTSTASASGSVESHFRVFNDTVGIARWDFSGGSGSLVLSHFDTGEILFSTEGQDQAARLGGVSLFAGVDYRITMFAEQSTAVPGSDASFVSFVPSPGSATMLGLFGLAASRRRR